jgi:hypothetical protein
MAGCPVTIKVKWTKLNVDAIVRQAEAVEKDAMRAAKAMVRSVLVRNIGTQYFDLWQLHKLGHPYGYGRSGRPGGIPAGVVNRQSGRFYRDFFIRGPLHTGKRISITVGQNGWGQIQGEWLAAGTDRMRGRPWQKHLQKEISKVVRPYLFKTLNERLRLTVKSHGTR